MLKSLLARWRQNRSVVQTFESTWGSSTPQTHSLLPAEADDVRELDRAVTNAIREELAKKGLATADVELRRRISRREYRAYISLRSEQDIRMLATFADELVKVVLDEYRIEIARVYWQYKRPN